MRSAYSLDIASLSIAHFIRFYYDSDKAKKLPHLCDGSPRKAQELESLGKNIIHLEIGPDFNAPHICSSIICSVVR